VRLVPTLPLPPTPFPPFPCPAILIVYTVITDLAHLSAG
jgi:hypothetical protein